MYKYDLGDYVFAICKNKICKGLIVARQHSENLNSSFKIFDKDGITYAVLFENSVTWQYQEEHVFSSLSDCVEYISYVDET